MSYKSYIILLVASASFLVSCNKSEEYFGLGKDGCLQFRAKMVDNLDVEEKMSKDSTYKAGTRSDDFAVYTRDTIFVDSDVYVTADVDYINSNTVATRGVPLDSELKIPSLKVHVFNTKTYTWASGGNRTLENELSMPNSSGGNFDYMPLILFKKDGNNRSFIAYSPIESSANGVVEKSGTELTYTVPADVTKHPDICTSQLSGNTDVKNTGGGEHIRDFALKHELTAIGFALRGSGVKIYHIAIKGVKIEGTLNLDTKAWSLGSATQVRNPKIKDQFYDVGWTESWVDCTEPNGYLMMIPQTLTDDAQLTIFYGYDYGENKGETQILTSNLRKLTGGVWAAGKRITYNIRFKADPAVTAGDLLIDCSLAGYTTESTINMANNVASDDVLTFTWDASWLKIHQGSPKENNTSGGATSGWSVATNKPLDNLYFFAADNNPSAMTRTATVTVRGKKSLERTFKVTQKAKPTLSVNKTFINIKDYVGVSDAYKADNLNVITFTSSTPDNVTVTPTVGWIRSSVNYTKGQIPFNYQWNIMGGTAAGEYSSRDGYLDVKVIEKGNVANQVRITIRQIGNTSGNWIMVESKDLWNDAISVYSGGIQATDAGAHYTGTNEVRKWCNGPGAGFSLFSAAKWEKVMRFVFSGAWGGRANLNQSRYWTNEYNFGFWSDLGKAINIDWNKKTYYFSTPKEDTNIEHRCGYNTYN